MLLVRLLHLFSLLLLFDLLLEEHGLTCAWGSLFSRRAISAISMTMTLLENEHQWRWMAIHSTCLLTILTYSCIYVQVSARQYSSVLHVCKDCATLYCTVKPCKTVNQIDLCWWISFIHRRIVLVRSVTRWCDSYSCPGACLRRASALAVVPSLEHRSFKGLGISWGPATILLSKFHTFLIPHVQDFRMETWGLSGFSHALW